MLLQHSICNIVQIYQIPLLCKLFRTYSNQVYQKRLHVKHNKLVMIFILDILIRQFTDIRFLLAILCIVFCVVFLSLHLSDALVTQVVVTREAMVPGIAL